jgi:hypothetical protein
MHCEWRGVGGGLGMQALVGVRGVLGGSGMIAGSGVEGVGGVAVDSLFAPGMCILSPSS